MMFSTYLPYTLFSFFCGTLSLSLSLFRLSPSLPLPDYFLLKILVVSTIISGILFAHISTVERILTIYSFLVTSLTVRSKKWKSLGCWNCIVTQFWTLNVHGLTCGESVALSTPYTFEVKFTQSFKLDF